MPCRPSSLTVLSALKPIETVLAAVLVAAILPCSIVYLSTKSSILSLTTFNRDHPAEQEGLLLDPEGQHITAGGGGAEEEGGDCYALHVLFGVERLYRRYFWSSRGERREDGGGDGYEKREGEVRDYVWPPTPREVGDGE
ncbi:hypothetical protein GE09DRAFT_1064559 [Coniochaeta sp. 2T2.1]|nr:hypothetical protein GE09DRAFT_1064559 [Coniochaeta sp. 2T2.1]